MQANIFGVQNNIKHTFKILIAYRYSCFQKPPRNICAKKVNILNQQIPSSNCFEQIVTDITVARILELELTQIFGGKISSKFNIIFIVTQSLSVQQWASSLRLRFS